MMGKMDVCYPTPIGSGILERKYGLTVQLPTIAESERAALLLTKSQNVWSMMTEMMRIWDVCQQHHQQHHHHIVDH
jgi:hypothetical protein